MESLVPWTKWKVKVPLFGSFFFICVLIMAKNILTGANRVGPLTLSLNIPS